MSQGGHQGIQVIGGAHPNVGGNKYADPMPNVEVLRIDSDSHRASAEQLFSQNISDPTRSPLPPQARDPHQGHTTYLLTIVEDGNVIAALHAAPPVMEVEQLLTRGLPEASGEAALKDFVMLYSLATAETHRKQGLGARLLMRLHELAYADGFSCVYGVTEGENAPFYRKNGYTVLDVEQTLLVKWGDRISAFPITGDAQWFTRSIDREPPLHEPVDKDYPAPYLARLVGKVRRLFSSART